MKNWIIGIVALLLAVSVLIFSIKQEEKEKRLTKQKTLSMLWSNNYIESGEYIFVSNKPKVMLKIGKYQDKEYLYLYTANDISESSIINLDSYARIRTFPTEHIIRLDYDGGHDSLSIKDALDEMEMAYTFTIMTKEFYNQ